MVSSCRYAVIGSTPRRPWAFMIGWCGQWTTQSSRPWARRTSTCCKCAGGGKLPRVRRLPGGDDPVGRPCSGTVHSRGRGLGKARTLRRGRQPGHAGHRHSRAGQGGGGGRSMADGESSRHDRARVHIRPAEGAAGEPGGHGGGGTRKLNLGKGSAEPVERPNEVSLSITKQMPTTPAVRRPEPRNWSRVVPGQHRRQSALQALGTVDHQCPDHGDPRRKVVDLPA